MIEKKDAGQERPKAGFYKTDLTPEWKKVRKVINLENSLEYEDWQKVDFPCLAGGQKSENAGLKKSGAVVYGDDKGARFRLEGRGQSVDLFRPSYSGNLRYDRRNRQCHEVGLQL